MFVYSLLRLCDSCENTTNLVASCARFRLRTALLVLSLGVLFSMLLDLLYRIDKVISFCVSSKAK